MTTKRRKTICCLTRKKWREINTIITMGEVDAMEMMTRICWKIRYHLLEQKNKKMKKELVKIKRNRSKILMKMEILMGIKIKMKMKTTIIKITITVQIV